MSDTLITPTSPFAGLRRQAPDALLGLISQFRQDRRATKLDLGVGIYRDEKGLTPVMRSVKAAEALLWQNQPTKAYLGADGDMAYIALLGRLALGPVLSTSDRITGVQTPGGTGALRLGAEMIARSNPDAIMWIGQPTWPNHGPIFQEAGLEVRAHRFFDPRSQGIDFDGMLADLKDARPGDILLLHGCCHNPTGTTFTAEQWAEIAGLCARAGLTPFIDLAYQGLGDGLTQDATAARALLEHLPDALLAYSCDKNFGLYRERVGALWLQGASRTVADVAHGNMLSLARSLWSMPPDHGAAIVRTILDTPELCADWEDELNEMRMRITILRRTLAAGHPALAVVCAQRGMFTLLPLTPADVVELRERQGIYMAGNGRINICGLTRQSIPAFLTSLAPYLPKTRGA